MAYVFWIYFSEFYLIEQYVEGGLIRDKLIPVIKEWYYKVFPCQRVCPVEYKIICAKNSQNDQITFSNLCELMKVNKCYRQG